jgi:hypothetical protein
MKKIILFLVVIIVVSGAFFSYKFLYHDHRDASSEDAQFTLSVKNLHSEFVMNDSLANAKYAGKTIAIYGKVTALDLLSNSIIIDEQLAIDLKEKSESSVSKQQSIKIKGRFVGYDDLLEELKMDQAIIIE